MSDAHASLFERPKRRQVVRVRFCSHPACHRLVKGLPGAACDYHKGLPNA